MKNHEINEILHLNKVLDRTLERKDYRAYEKFALKLHKIEVANHVEIGSFRIKR